MKMHALVATLICSLAAGTPVSRALAKENPPEPMKTTPTWSLAAPVEVTGEATQAAPHTASNDARLFAVRMTCTLPKPSTLPQRQRVKKRVKVLSQETEGTGWSIGFYQTTGNTVQLEIFLNGKKYGCGFLSLGWIEQRPELDGVFTITMVARRGGVVSFYINPENWWGKTAHFATAICPNLEPIRIGWADPEYLKRCKSEPMDGFTVKSLAFYGPDEDWWPKGAKRDIPMMSRVGNGWDMSIPGTVEDAKRPKVFCYGDSIYWGYGELLRKRLDGKAYVYGWMGFNESTELSDRERTAFTEAAASEKFDYIVFNNGLHSLHWKQERETDAQVKAHYGDMVDAFRKGAPQAKLFYLMTTPHIASAPKGQKATGLGPRNDVVLRLNRLAGEVMKERNVGIIDVYTPLSRHLELANGGGDNYHWTRAGYERLVDEIEKTLQKEMMK